MALRNHPLRNPEARQAEFQAKFVAVSEAYEILSHPIRKRVYDKYGLNSVRNGIPSGPDKFDGYVFGGDPYKTFLHFFGSNNPFVEQTRICPENDPTL